MSAERVNIRGLSELDRMLKQLPAKVEGKIVRQGLNAASRVIRDEAKRLAPKTGDGDLEKSIRVSSRIDKKRGRITSKVVAGNREVYYAHMIEYGTGAFYSGTKTNSKRRAYVIRPEKKGALAFGNTIRKAVLHPGIKPEPFMRPAFDSKDEEAIRAFAAKVRKAIEREAKKLGGGSKS